MTKVSGVIILLSCVSACNDWPTQEKDDTGDNDLMVEDSTYSADVKRTSSFFQLTASRTCIFMERILPLGRPRQKVF